MRESWLINASPLLRDSFPVSVHIDATERRGFDCVAAGTERKRIAFALQPAGHPGREPGR